MTETHKHVKNYSHKTTWAEALADAKAQLAAARRRVRELSEAVRVCERRVLERDQFPGQQSGAD